MAVTTLQSALNNARRHMEVYRQQPKEFAVRSVDNAYTIDLKVCSGTCVGRKPWHSHERCEVLIVYDAGVIVTGESWMRVLLPGDVIVFRGDIMHSTRSFLSQYLCTCIMFSTAELKQFPQCNWLLYGPMPCVASLAGHLWDQLGPALEQLWTLAGKDTNGAVATVALLGLLELIRKWATLTGTQQEQPVVRTALDYMITMADADISMSELAARCYVSERYLRRLFHEHLGCSPHKIWTMIKVEYASMLLRRGSRVDDLARAVGYESRRGVEMAFRRVTGRSPVSYGACKATS